MIKSINSSGRYITVSGGQPSSTYINGYSGAQGVGNVRYNTVNQGFDVYDGNNWVPLGIGYATVELSHEAQELLEWARKKRDQEATALELAKTNATVADALNTANQAQEQLDIVVALTKVE